MVESILCSKLRNTLLDHQNELQVVRSQLFRAESERKRLDRQITSLESQIQDARTSAQIARSAGRVLGPLGGAAVAVLSSTEASIRIARLESEKMNAKNNLSRASSEVSRLEEKLREHEFGIPNTRREMQREGCEMP